MKKNIYVVFALLLLLSSSACDSWLDIKPEDKIEEDELLKDVEGAGRALNGIYLQLVSGSLYGGSLSWGVLDAMAQSYNIKEGVSESSIHPYKWYANWEYTNPITKGAYEDIWKQTYYTIANINNLLENIVPIKELFVPSFYNQFRGELYALRAYLHFDMYRLFGPMNYNASKSDKTIPYYTKRTNAPQPILTAEEVMSHIDADLVLAEKLLQEEELFSGSSYLRRYRMNYVAVRALQARVALFKGDNTTAYRCALELVGSNGGVAGLVEDHFPWDNERSNSMGSDEVFFGMQNSKRESIYLDNFKETVDDEYFLGVTVAFFNNLFPQISSSIDIRKKSFNSLGEKVVFSKYQINTADKNQTTNRMHPLIRKSEMMLILVETAKTLKEQVEWLDVLYVNRGFQSGEVGQIVTPGVGAEHIPIDDFIQDEYRREFFGEGQYFYFLKRKGIDKITSQNTVTYDMGPAQYVVPIPDSEINFRD